MRGQQAMRSGAALLLPPEDLDDIPDEQADIDNQQAQANAKYASLKGHPGWELIRKDFEATIASYRSGKPLQEAIKQGKTLEDIGKLTILSNAIADELEQKLLTVEGAAMALEEDVRPKRRSS